MPSLSCSSNDLSAKLSARREICQRGYCTVLLSSDTPPAKAASNLSLSSVTYQLNGSLVSEVSKDPSREDGTTWYRTEAAAVRFRPRYVALAGKEPGLEIRLVDSENFLRYLTYTEIRLMQQSLAYSHVSAGGQHRSFGALLSPYVPLGKFALNFDYASIQPKNPFVEMLHHKIQAYADAYAEAIHLSPQHLILLDARRMLYALAGSGTADKIWLE